MFLDWEEFIYLFYFFSFILNLFKKILSDQSHYDILKARMTQIDFIISCTLTQGQCQQVMVIKIKAMAN